MEYDAKSGEYYCPRCEKHWEPADAEQKKTMYQDSTENTAPDTTSYWDEHAQEENEEAEE